MITIIAIISDGEKEGDDDDEDDDNTIIRRARMGY